MIKLVLVVAFFVHLKVSDGSQNAEKSKEFWNQSAQNFLREKLTRKLNTNRAKNIIFFIGDGMSFQTVAATRMLLGSEESELSFEKFPHYGITKTYCTNLQVADSACTATAFLGGIKASSRTLGVNGNVKDAQCEVNEDDHVESILSWAQKSCKATGIVTTTKITHATPGGAYANTASRDWENNEIIKLKCPDHAESIIDIGRQFVHGKIGSKLKVALGGGRKQLINSTEIDEEGRPGLRTDGKNLINEWISDRSKRGETKYVWHKQQLNEVDFDKTDYLLGLFENDHCMYNLDIVENNLQDQEPSLTDMTAAAIKILRKDQEGFFLFVEGGKIDIAHHNNWAYKALDETKEFARAIEMARSMTSENDTLIVVSADHGHVMNYAGDAKRGNDILGLVDTGRISYLALSYGNGPGYYTKLNLTHSNLHGLNFQQSATVPRNEDTHGGDDVGVYASGPWSHLFAGHYEQNNIPLLMAYASKMGVYREDDAVCKGSSLINISSVFLIFFSFVIYCFL